MATGIDEASNVVKIVHVQRHLSLSLPLPPLVSLASRSLFHFTYVLLVIVKAVDHVLTLVHDRAEEGGRRVRVLAEDVHHVIYHPRVLAAGGVHGRECD